MDQERDRQTRRTRNARRAVIGLGAGGALTVAGVVGVGIAQAQPDAQPDARPDARDTSTSPTRSDDDGGFQQNQQNGQPHLAAPGNDGPAQGSTSGS